MTICQSLNQLLAASSTKPFHNLHNNVERKKAKYEDLIEEMKDNFVSVKFVNLSISCLGVFDRECRTFLEMLDTLGLGESYQRYTV